jgi:hypothetical protein
MQIFMLTGMMAILQSIGIPQGLSSPFWQRPYRLEVRLLLVGMRQPLPFFLPLRPLRSLCLGEENCE